MSTYCISDIHGCFNRFMGLLETIEFNPDNDKLYILGDCMDRGPDSIKTVQHIMKMKSVEYILGNHDIMMMDYLVGRRDVSWVDEANGGDIVLPLFKALPKPERLEIIQWLEGRKLYEKLEVNGKRFLLVHAGFQKDRPLYYQNTFDLIWMREEFYEHQYRKKSTVIFGHTPTSHMRTSPQDRVSGAARHFIWADMKWKDKIGIDCGCYRSGLLGAIRLDDAKCFYYNSDECKGEHDTIPAEFWDRSDIVDEVIEKVEAS